MSAWSGPGSGPALIQGSGLPALTRLRANQKPPVISELTTQIPVVLSRNPLPATAITPSVSNPNGASRLSFVPSASPAARPATISAPVGNRRMRRRPRAALAVLAFAAAPRR